MPSTAVHKIFPAPSILETARAALLTETAGLQALINSMVSSNANSLNGSLGENLGENFEKTVKAIEGLKGRVIISGMGKSAHVARKIAATFASTGQPAYFVHPAEASHGDLGMITADDLVIALSYSGETRELENLVVYTQRLNITLVAITGKPHGTLAKVAPLVLILPPATEACPMGLAPTTSTTMMMALGDALAIALLSQRGFTSRDFLQFHPGGNLGKSLMRVSERMHPVDELPLVTEHTLMSDALVTMSNKSFGCAGVLNSDGCLIGIITDGDLRRHMSPQLLMQKASEIMTPNPATVTPDILMAQAFALLNQRAKKPITTLFVVESTDYPAKPCGLLHIHDFLRMGMA